MTMWLYFPWHIKKNGSSNPAILAPIGEVCLGCRLPWDTHSSSERSTCSTLQQYEAYATTYETLKNAALHYVPFFWLVHDEKQKDMLMR